MGVEGECPEIFYVIVENLLSISYTNFYVLVGVTFTGKMIGFYGKVFEPFRSGLTGCSDGGVEMTRRGDVRALSQRCSRAVAKKLESGRPEKREV